MDTQETHIIGAIIGGKIVMYDPTVLTGDDPRKPSRALVKVDNPADDGVVPAPTNGDTDQ